MQFTRVADMRPAAVDPLHTCYDYISGQGRVSAQGRISPQRSRKYHTRNTHEYRLVCPVMHESQSSQHFARSRLIHMQPPHTDEEMNAEAELRGGGFPVPGTPSIGFLHRL